MAEIATQSTAQRLAKAVTAWSDKRLERFRNVRKAMLKEFGGPWFGETDENDPSMNSVGPLNIFYSVTSILIPSLYLEPRPQVKTHKINFNEQAGKLELALERVNYLDDYAETGRNALMEALWGRGIVWTGLQSADPRPDSYQSDPGSVTTQLVREEDWIEDLAASDDSCRSFMGHRFRVPYEWAQDSGLYDSAELERIYKLQQDRWQNRGAWSESQKQLATDRFLDEIELASLYLPRHNGGDGLVVTLPGNMDDAQKYLREDAYFGPNGGPYDKLIFTRMPDSALPIPPMSVIKDLVRIIGNIAAKIDERVRNTKDVGVYQPANEKLGKAVMNANDGDFLIGDGKSGQVFKLGGNIEELTKALSFFYELLNKMVGNPDLLGGLASQSPTASQDAMLFGAAQTTVGDKRGRVVKFHNKVQAKRAWYVWNDPAQRSMDLLQTIPGAGDIQVQWDPSQKEGQYEDFDFEVRTYSAKSESPEAQAAAVDRWVSETVIPLAGIAMQTGMIPDVAKIAEITGKARDIPESDSIFRSQVEQQSPEMTVNQGGTVNNNPMRPSPRQFAGVEQQAQAKETAGV